MYTNIHARAVGKWSSIAELVACYFQFIMKKSCILSWERIPTFKLYHIKKKMVIF